jgi:hypothetical protein
MAQRRIFVLSLRALWPYRPNPVKTYNLTNEVHDGTLSIRNEADLGSIQ